MDIDPATACGCLPAPEDSLRWQAEAVASAPTISEYVWASDLEEQPVIKWSDDFDRLLEERTKIIRNAESKGFPLKSWEIFRLLPAERKLSNRLWWNQGSVPSCSLHGTVHATQINILKEIALGAPRKYDALNPIYPFYLARGGNLAGGLNLIDAADQVGTGGNYPVSEVGENNTSAPRDWKQFEEIAKRYQSAAVILENDLTEKVFAAAKAGFAVVFGSGIYFQTSKVNASGVKVMVGIGSGGHAQALGEYEEVDGVEYIFLFNSWGDRYGDWDGSPKTGAWVTRDQVATLLQNASIYGAPFIPLSENPQKSEPRLFNPVR